MAFLESFLIKTAGARMFIKDHEAAIEVGTGIACFALSVAMAAKAGIKTKAIMEEYNNERIKKEVNLHSGVVTIVDADNQTEIVQYTEEDHKKEIRKLKLHTAGKIALAWTPSLLGFAGGTGLVLRSHHVMVKSNLALAAALKTSEETLEKYRAKMGEKIGKEEEQKIYEGREEKKVKAKLECLQGTPLSPYSRLMSRDTLSRNGDWCDSSEDYNYKRVKEGERWANKRLRTHGRVTFNDVLEWLGLEISEDGDVVGWKLEKYGGKTPEDGIIFNIHRQVGGNINETRYVKDEWTDSLIKAADPFWLDFNCEGCILGNSTLRKLQ